MLGTPYEAEVAAYCGSAGRVASAPVRGMAFAFHRGNAYQIARRGLERSCGMNIGLPPRSGRSQLEHNLLKTRQTYSQKQ